MRIRSTENDLLWYCKKSGVRVWCHRVKRNKKKSKVNENLWERKSRRKFVSGPGSGPEAGLVQL
jgi:hypothetical protein